MRGITQFVAAATAMSVPLLASTTACELSLPGSDGGEDAESDAGTATMTLNDQCQMILAAFCSTASQCSALSGETIGECISSNLYECCIGSACDAKSTFSSSDVSACTSAIESEGCYAISTSGIAAQSACAGFVTDQ